MVANPAELAGFAFVSNEAELSQGRQQAQAALKREKLPGEFSKKKQTTGPSILSNIAEARIFKKFPKSNTKTARPNPIFSKISPNFDVRIF